MSMLHKAPQLSTLQTTVLEFSTEELLALLDFLQLDERAVYVVPILQQLELQLLADLQLLLVELQTALIIEPDIHCIAIANT